MRTPHLACKKGKKVIIGLRTGETIEDVFEEKHSQYIVVKDAGKIQIREIRFFLIKR